MADRVSACIEIGGNLTPAQFTTLSRLIALEDLSIEWDGEIFRPGDYQPGTSLTLYAHEVPNGRFRDLEAWLTEQAIAYIRSSAGDRNLSANRTVFTGIGEPRSYPIDDDDVVVMTEETIDALGTLEAIKAYFTEANFTPPVMAISELT